MMEKLYFPSDVETSGPSPGKYSMLSLGSCIIGDTSTFYVEIKPISRLYVPAAIKVASRGLKCLEGMRSREVNPMSKHFKPELVLDILTEEGDEPIKAIAHYADWIKDKAKGRRPVIAAAPIMFDGMFITWYFDNFYDGPNPFGYSGEDINSLLRGASNDLEANIKKFFREELAHNALGDSKMQAEPFRLVLEKIAAASALKR